MATPWGGRPAPSGAAPRGDESEQARQGARRQLDRRAGGAAAGAPPTVGPYDLSKFVKDKDPRTVRVYKEGEKPCGGALRLLKEFPDYKDYKYTRVSKHVVVKYEGEVVCAAVLKLGTELEDLELAYIHTREGEEGKGHARCALAHVLAHSVCTSDRTLKIEVADAAGTKKTCSRAQCF